MTREEFDRILKEEGITRQALPDDLWRTSPVAHEALEEKRLRKASRPGEVQVASVNRHL